MEAATLGNLQGAGLMRSRQRTASERDYRGMFAFAREHEAAIVELLNGRDQVEFHGLIHGHRRRLKVIVTDVSLETGLAYLLGLGEPYGELEKAAGE